MCVKKRERLSFNYSIDKAKMQSMQLSPSEKHRLKKKKDKSVTSIPNLKGAIKAMSMQTQEA